MAKVKCIHCGKEFVIPKKTKEINPNSKEIVDIIEVFSKINPDIRYGHRGYRNDAEALIKRFGVEEALNFAKFAVKIQGQPFSPTITTPTALRNKLGDLMVYYKKSSSGRTAHIK